MQEAGYYQSQRTSPSALAIVVAMHAAAIGWLAMAKMEVVPGFRPKPTEIEFITEPLPPPPNEIEKADAPPMRPAEITYRKPIVDMPSPNRVDLPAVESDNPPRLPDLSGPVVRDTPPAQPRTEPQPQPRAEPVRVEAEIDPRYARQLQPPYPASEERMGNEGTVVVRVTIGADGRVKAVEKVRATSDAFFRATERHAISAWRFKPAMVDGKPVESSKQMSVKFELRG